MENFKIGFFDSGIGGVTVLKECIKLVPNVNYIYFSDSINNPYGDRSEEEIIKIAKKNTDFLISKGCKIIVIACNTASAIAVNQLRKDYENISFIAIEPAIKLAYDLNGSTLVMATKGTLDSEKFHELFEKYHNEKFYLLPCVGLANIIEKGDELEINEYLKMHLSEYNGIQNVVLGCTHYPLIKDKIKKIVDAENILDGSVGVAKQLKRVIGEYNLAQDNTNIEFLDSSKSLEKENRFWKYLNK